MTLNSTTVPVENLLDCKATILEALEKLNNVPDSLTLFVVDKEGKLLGTLTDGDIRRGLLRGKTLNDSVDVVMHRDFRFLRNHKFSISEIIAFREKKISLIPLLDEKDRIVRLIQLNRLRSMLPVQAVIMAGGRGERLRPLTDNTPKSLLPVGNKPILEHTLDRLRSFGITDIFLSVHYLADEIIRYFGDGSDRGIRISYLRESKPMGTIGSINLADKFPFRDILLMNADLLTNIDFEEFYLSHLNEKADLSVASVPYNVELPYAILETHDQKVVSFREKPTYTYFSNAGMYLFRKDLLEYIPSGTRYDATDFMNALLGQGKKVSCYPFHGYWLDIGRHEDYTKAIADIQHIKL